jgi:hypothetical protein
VEKLSEIEQTTAPDMSTFDESPHFVWKEANHVTRLALRAAARTAGVEGEGCFVRAVLTRIPMPAKGSSAATLHGPVCLKLLIVENSLEALQKLLALATDDVGHFEGRPRHERGR